MKLPAYLQDEARTWSHSEIKTWTFRDQLDGDQELESLKDMWRKKLGGREFIKACFEEIPQEEEEIHVFFNNTHHIWTNHPLSTL